MYIYKYIYAYLQSRSVRTLCRRLYINLTVVQQLRHVSDRTPDSHQVWAFCFRCWASPMRMCRRTSTLSWFFMTSAHLPYVPFIKSYTYGNWNAPWKLRIGVHLGKLPNCKEDSILQALHSGCEPIGGQYCFGTWSGCALAYTTHT
jgi:hypothetical protein